MKVVFHNNDGSGFAQELEVPAHTTAGDLFTQRVGGDPANYTIRVTRKDADGTLKRFTPAKGDLLKDGDRYSALPSKVEGAQ